jgi:hypothetical protein
MSEHEQESAWGSEVGDSVIAPNRSPNRFGPRPDSPILAKQFDAMVAAEKAKDAEAADAAREEEIIEQAAQRAAKIEARKRELLGD